MDDAEGLKPIGSAHTIFSSNVTGKPEKDIVETPETESSELDDKELTSTHHHTLSEI